MKEFYSEIFKWIKHPDEINLDVRPPEKLIIVSKILLLDCLLGLLFSVLAYLVDSYIIKLDMPLDDSHPVLIFFLVVLIAPIIEESIFRFPLKYQRNYLARLISFLSKGWLKKRWGSFFKYFLYLSIILFGVIHLLNFSNSEILFFVFSPVIIGSQLTGGILLSYTRIKLGFVWSIFQHSVFNLILLVLVIFFSHNHIIAQESNKDVSIKIVEQAYVYKHNSYYESESSRDTIFSIKANDISLSTFIDSLNIKNIKHFEDKWIDVQINCEKGIRKMDLKNLLKKLIQPDH